jgi:glycerophosphoryl diester phosphodiesterase
MLEMDVCITKDEVLVVHHDLDLFRTCGLKAKVSDLPFIELPRIQSDVEVHFAE